MKQIDGQYSLFDSEEPQEEGEVVQEQATIEEEDQCCATCFYCFERNGELKCYQMAGDRAIEFGVTTVYFTMRVKPNNLCSDGFWKPKKQREGEKE